MNTEQANWRRLERGHPVAVIRRMIKPIKTYWIGGRVKVAMVKCKVRGARCKEGIV